MEPYKYDGMMVCCPECGTPNVISYNVVRCSCCDWFAADSDLDELMALTPEENERQKKMVKFALMIIALLAFCTVNMFAYFSGVAYAITNTEVSYHAGEVTLELYGREYMHIAAGWYE